MIENKIILGSSNFGNFYGFNKKIINLDEVKYLKSLLNKLNLKSIDTAPSYGNSEKIIGEVFKDDNLNIYTKLNKVENKYFISDTDLDNIKNCFFYSLKNLKRNKIEGVLVHQCEDLFKTNSNKLFQLIKNFKENNLVSKIGVSIYNPSDFLKIFNEYEFDFVQFPINLFDQRFISDEIISYKNIRDIEFHGRSIFLQGLLLKNFHELPNNFKSFKKNFENLNLFLNENNIKKLSLLVNFIKNIKFLDKILIGFSSNEQLIEVIREFKSIEKLDIKYKNFKSEQVQLLDPRNWN